MLGDNARIGKTEGRANTSAARFDPFEGMPTYSQRYTRKRRKIPKLDTRPYSTLPLLSAFKFRLNHSYITVLKFFPKELWSILDPSSTTSNGAGTESSSKPKLLFSATSRVTNGLCAHDRELSGEPGQLNRNGEDDEENVEKVDEDELPPEEEVDSEYDSDEGSMAGDYNAEHYFDDGGDDAGDDYDAGEADGGEYD